MTPRLLPIAALVASADVHATELTWEGHFRSRARYFDSLSLSDTNAYAEGASMGLDTRLRLQPGLVLSDKVAIYTQVDLLPYVSWGDEATDTAPFTGDDVPVAYSQSVTPPTDEDGAATLQNIQVTRAWAEVGLPFGRLRFGRMPVQWGSGMVWNAGNDPLSEYGDTADRLQITALTGPVYVIGAYELPFEGLVNQKDDLHSLVGGVVYQTETVGLGTYNVYRWMNDGTDKFGAYIGDVWGRAELGGGSVEAEFAAVVGSGDLDATTNDVRISSFGAHLNGEMPLDKLRVGLMAGFAGGDGDESDSKLHTFTFDPDFNVGLLLFEEPLPTLEAASPSSTNGGRNYDATLTWDGVSNALFARPRVGYQLRDDLLGEISLLAATRARQTDDEKDAGTDNKSYGLELDADIHYEPVDFVRLQATGAVLFPGTFYKDYEDDTLGGDFDQPAFGLRLVGAIEF